MNQFFKQLKNVKMTSAEKSRIRHTLVTLTKSRMSDYRSPAQAKRGAIKSPMYTWRFATNFRTVGAAFLIFVLASTGISFAAESTLPGDLLYGVKVNVTEEVRGALITSSDAKMNWEKERVVRRVVETETLLKKDDITPKQKIQAEAAIKTQMETFATAAAATSEKNPSAVIAATAELEPTLKVHQEVIASIAATSGADTPETTQILSTVAKGITATSEQETVAIASAVVNAPDTFAKLTDDKITGAEIAIDTSDINIKEEDTSAALMSADAKSIDAKAVDASSPDTTPTTTEVTTPVTDTPKLQSITDTTLTTKEKTDVKTDTKTDIKTDIKKDDLVPPTADATASLKSVAAAPIVITLDPKEILANAKAKLAQAKVLREHGDFKAALTLAQDAYKDMVGLRLQAKIAKKNQAEIKDVPATTTDKTQGEVKGVQTEQKDATKVETKTDTDTKVDTKVETKDPTTVPVLPTPKN